MAPTAGSTTTSGSASATFQPQESLSTPSVHPACPSDLHLLPIHSVTRTAPCGPSTTSLSVRVSFFSDFASTPMLFTSRPYYSSAVRWPHLRPLRTRPCLLSAGLKSPTSCRHPSLITKTGSAILGSGLLATAIAQELYMFNEETVIAAGYFILFAYIAKVRTLPWGANFSFCIVLFFSLWGLSVV
jgi:hypothetical protein